MNLSYKSVLQINILGKNEFLCTNMIKYRKKNFNFYKSVLYSFI